MVIIVSDVYEIYSNTHRYYLLNTDTGIMGDLSESDIITNINRINNAEYINNQLVIYNDIKHIIINDISTFTGKLIPGFNDFETYCRLNKRLDLLKEYDTRKNKKPINRISKAAIDKVWWKCSKCGHEWETNIKSRTRLNSGCPMCKFREGKFHILVKGENDALTYCRKHGLDHIIREFSENNTVNMEDIAYGDSEKKVLWVCEKCKREYSSIMSNRILNNSGCPSCNSNGKSIPEYIIYNYLIHYYSDIKHRVKVDNMEADIFIPKLNLIIDYIGIYFHRKAETLERDRNKLEIWHKHGRKVIIVHESRENNDNVKNNIVINNSKNKYLIENIVKAINNIGINVEYNKTYDNEAKEKAVRMKNNKKVLNSIAETNPEILEIWDYEKNGTLTPEMVTRGCKYKAWFKCKKCGQSYYSFIRKQVQGQRCPYCASNKTITGVNDIATLVPDLLLDWDYSKNDAIGLDPTKISPFSPKMAYFTCHLWGNETYQQINGKTRTQRGLVDGKYIPARCMVCQRKS